MQLGGTTGEMPTVGSAISGNTPNGAIAGCRKRQTRDIAIADNEPAMPTDLQFPLYALADAYTAKTIYGGNARSRRLLLFTSAEKASYYRRARDLAASIVRLREPRDVRILLSTQEQDAPFDVEIDPGAAEPKRAKI